MLEYEQGSPLAFSCGLVVRAIAEVVLVTQRLLSEAIERGGFEYEYREIDAALAVSVG